MPDSIRQQYQKGVKGKEVRGERYKQIIFGKRNAAPGFADFEFSHFCAEQQSKEHVRQFMPQNINTKRTGAKYPNGHP